MADFLLTLNTFNDIAVEQMKLVERFSTGPHCGCWVYGNSGTFCVSRKGDDAICSIGYLSDIDGHSFEDTLSEILTSFDETLIEDLKKKLIGQYLLMIRKSQEIYLFSDFLGARNIFYSDDGRAISSSYSKLEDLLGTSASDLDTYKVLEFLAMRHILYPAWLGHSTEHASIKWLLPNEYLVIDTEKGSFRLGSIVYSIDNKRESNRLSLSSELLSSLRAILSRSEFKDSPVAASLSGGRDSRLVAALAAEYYGKIHYRIAVAPGHYDSMKDMQVAKKLAQIRGVPLDVYQFQPERDQKRFRELTEGFSPTYNNKISAVIDNVGVYSIGFGGVFGTELFMPIPWASVDDFVEARVARAKQALKVEDDFWKHFRESLYEEFQRTKAHFLLSDNDDRHYIRLFIMLDTARYASFILSAFNSLGYQLEPYGSYAVLDLALRVAPEQWGNHRRLGGDALVQIASMATLNSRMARVLTYKNYRPMLPLSAAAAPLHMVGFTMQVCDWLRRKFDRRLSQSTKTEFPQGYYLSDGWESQFLGRTVDKYGLPVKFSVIA